MSLFEDMDIQYIKFVAFMQMLQTQYPGGIDAFRESGGFISAVPGHPMTIGVCHPSLPEALRKELESIKDYQVQVHDTPNFAGMEDAEASQTVKEYLLEKLPEIDLSVTIHIDRVFIVLGVLDIRPRKEQLQSLQSLLESCPGLLRGVIMYKDQTIWVAGQGGSSVQTPSIGAHVEAEAIYRGTVITDDDITNVRILLGKCETVEDFLKSI